MGSQPAWRGWLVGCEMRTEPSEEAWTTERCAPRAKEFGPLPEHQEIAEEFRGGRNKTLDESVTRTEIFVLCVHCCTPED